MSYNVDDFKGHPTKLLGIITNEDPQSVNRLDTETVIGEELQSTNYKQSTPSKVSVRQISMDFATEREGPQSTRVLDIYGTAEVNATLAGRMLKILHSHKLRVRCGLGEGKYIKAVEFHKRSSTRNEILKSHEKYVNITRKG